MTDRPDFGFCFEKPDDWDQKEHPSACANSLREALEADPSLVGLELFEVWCLRSCNLIWASEGYYFSGPWRDEDWVDAAP